MKIKKYWNDNKISIPQPFRLIDYRYDSNSSVLEFMDLSFKEVLSNILNYQFSKIMEALEKGLEKELEKELKKIIILIKSKIIKKIHPLKIKKVLNQII